MAKHFCKFYGVALLKLLVGMDRQMSYVRLGFGFGYSYG